MPKMIQIGFLNQTSNSETNQSLSAEPLKERCTTYDYFKCTPEPLLQNFKPYPLKTGNKHADSSGHSIEKQIKWLN